MKVIRESVIEKGEITSIAGFSYSSRDISSYDYLSLLFGQTTNLETFFGIPQNAKLNKTCVVVDIKKSFFDISMDYPDDGKLHGKDPEVIKRVDELIYVSSLIFGKRITMLVEADIPSSDLKGAIQEALESKANLSNRSKAILSNSNIKITVLGRLSLPESKNGNPLSAIMEYINKPVTIDDFGIPISFQGTYVKDGSVFENKF